MTKGSKIHQDISDAYARSVSDLKADNSDGGVGASTLKLAKGKLPPLVGYSDTQMQQAPPLAVENSFGCGNPVALSGIKSGQTVLDLGCGAGLDLLLMAEKVGGEGLVIGIDMTDEMLALAQKNIAGSEHRNIKLYKGLIENLPFADNSIDWIISNCVINLSPDKKSVFQEMIRVLRPGGEISIADIVIQELPTWLRLNADMYFACIAGAISESEYVNGLERSGFADVQVIDRLTYDQAMIRSILNMDGVVQSDQTKLSKGGLDYILQKIDGQIWSMRFRGRKSRVTKPNLHLHNLNHDNMAGCPNKTFYTPLSVFNSKAKETTTMTTQATINESNNETPTQVVEDKNKQYWDLLAFLLSNSISGEIIATENYALLVPLLDNTDDKLEASHQSYIESRHVLRLLALAERLNLPAVNTVVEPEWFSIRKNYDAAVARKDLAACFIAQDIMIECLAITGYKGLVGVGEVSTDADTSRTVESILQEEIEHFEIGIERMKRLLHKDAEKTHDALIWAHHRIMPDLLNIMNDGCTSLCDELGITCGSFGLEAINTTVQTGRDDMLRRYIDTLGRISFDPKVVNSLISGLSGYSSNVNELLPQNSARKSSCC